MEDLSTGESALREPEQRATCARPASPQVIFFKPIAEIEHKSCFPAEVPWTIATLLPWLEGWEYSKRHMTIHLHSTALVRLLPFIHLHVLF